MVETAVGCGYFGWGTIVSLATAFIRGKGLPLSAQKSSKKKS